jgi:hypothetical protein
MKEQQTIGQLSALYFDADALRLSPVPVFRIQTRGNRNYFVIGEDRKAILLDGVTTIVNSTLPKSEFLIKWMAEKGYDEAIEYRNIRALYGTLMHIMVAHILINKFVEVEDVDRAVKNYCLANGVNSGQAAGWTEDICSDLLAFAQFVRDYNVKPLAIEATLADTDLKIAGTTDLICEMDVDVKGFYGEVYKSGDQKGQPKLSTQTFRRKAIVDFKSGRSGANTDDKAAQLKFYELLSVKNFPDLFISGDPIMLFNWSPKDWRTKPDYTLTDQSNNFSEHEVMMMLDLYRCRLSTKLEERTVTTFKGRIEIGGELTDNYSILTTADMVQQRIDEMVAEKTKKESVLDEPLFPEYVYEGFTTLISNNNDKHEQSDKADDATDTKDNPSTDRQGSLWQEER